MSVAKEDKMAVPKRKVSHARKMKRRSSVWKLNAPTNLVKCPQCGEYIQAYRVCTNCGYYKGESVLAVGDKAEKNA